MSFDIKSVMKQKENLQWESETPAESSLQWELSKTLKGNMVFGGSCFRCCVCLTGVLVLLLAGTRPGISSIWSRAPTVCKSIQNTSIGSDRIQCKTAKGHRVSVLKSLGICMRAMGHKVNIHTRVLVSVRGLRATDWIYTRALVSVWGFSLWGSRETGFWLLLGVVSVLLTIYTPNYA